MTLDPAWREITFPVTVDQVSTFSSLGPNIDGSVKPDVMAPGTDVFTATQSLDPTGNLYDVSRYTAVQGTSFAVPTA